MASQSGDSGDEAALEASGPRPSTLDDFDVLERLGRGSFGAVFRVSKPSCGSCSAGRDRDPHVQCMRFRAAVWPIEVLGCTAASRAAAAVAGPCHQVPLAGRARHREAPAESLLPLGLLPPARASHPRSQLRPPRKHSPLPPPAPLQARRHADGAQYVIKKIDIHDMPPAEQLGAAREAQIMAALDHPHVVRYFDSFVDGGVLCIVMELCRGGDLQAWLKQRDGRALPERTVWRVFLELCLALHYLHSQRVLHRDLKTANVFLVDPVDDGSPAEPARRGDQRSEAEEGGDIAPVAEPAAAGQGSGAGPRVSVKIGDLGVARVLGSQTHFARTCVGTPFYLSPELVNGAEYDGRSDVWALGCILYELCTLRHPFDARNQGALIFKIMQGRYPALPEGRYSADLVGLVDRLLVRDSGRRPDVAAILAAEPVARRAKALGIDLPADVLA
ncbi:NEK1, partial [Symbiodinium sp. KB8]